MLRTLTRVGHRQLHTSTALGVRLPGSDDTKDVWKILKNDVFDGRLENYLPCPRQTDVLIIGGSVIGSSIAYHVKNQMNKMEVAIIEPDQTYAKASALLSVGGMRQQFSSRENIYMSQYGFEFLRHAKELLAVPDASELPPDVQFNQAGYVILGSEDMADTMLHNHRLQEECGVKNVLLSKDQLAKKYPWLNVEGVELGSIGQQAEGWFDPAPFLAALRVKNKSLGVKYVSGKVTGFEQKYVQLSAGTGRQILSEALVTMPNGDIQPVKAPIFVNAAGSWAGEVAKMAGIGNDNSLLECSVPLPVERRKRMVFAFHCPNGPGLDCPLLTDQMQDNLYFRREGFGNIYLSSKAPADGEEPSTEDLEVDHSFFDTKMWPQLAYRVPAFENLKVKSAWSGYYDYNYIDQNLIIGNHPYFNNFMFANGSSGHGLQHSMAIGKAVMEQIVHNEYRTIDLSSLGFERFLDPDYKAEAETNIY